MRWIGTTNIAFEFYDNPVEREMSAHSVEGFSCPAGGTGSKKRKFVSQNSQTTKESSMAASRKFVTTTVFAASALGLFLLVAAAPSRAQANSTSAGDAYPLDSSTLRPWLAPDSDAAGQPAVGDPAAPVPPQAKASTGSADDAWHLAVSPYLWFPGVHGTAVGPNGNGLGFRASPSDLLSHFQIGLMGAVEVSHKRLVTSMDIFWIRLEDDTAIPLPPAVGAGAIGAKIHATEFFLTPKIGLRVIDEEKIKVDALAGFRFWHFGESLSFNPSLLGLNFTGSQNFVDPVVGGRIQLDLSPKIVVNILGDVGGWNTGSKLEYQVAGLLGYRIKPALTLQAGYRYLNLDYRGSRGVVFDLTTAGVLFGATLTLK
jgi:hypothetical protein